MKKKLLIGLSILILIILLVVIIFNSSKNEGVKEIDLISGNSEWTQDQQYNYQKSIVDICNKYLEAAEATNAVFFTDMSTKTYQEWKIESDKAIAAWQDLELISEEMNGLLDELGVPQEEIVQKNNYFFIPAALAAKSGTPIPELGAVTAVFDSAEHGQKLRRVIEVFGWDARTALYHLQREQNELEAEAWDKAGDTYQRWETAARAIKDVSKVTVFVGANIITAGGASAVVTLGQGTLLAVSGVSLALEVGEDVYVSFGNEEDAAVLRKTQETIKPVTEIVSIISLKDIGDPNNLYYLADKTGQLYDAAGNAILWITKKDGKIIISNEKPAEINLPEGIENGDSNKTQNETNVQEQTQAQQQSGKPEVVEVPIDIPQGHLYFVGEFVISGEQEKNSWGTSKLAGDTDLEFTIDMTDNWGVHGNNYSITGNLEGFYQEYVLCNEDAGSYGNYVDEGGYMCIKNDVKYSIGTWYPIGTQRDLTTELEGYLELPNDDFCDFSEKNGSNLCQQYPYGRVVIESPDKNISFIGGFTSESRTRIEGESWYADAK